MNWQPLMNNVYSPPARTKRAVSLAREKRASNWLTVIGHFRVPFSLSFKASLSAKFLLW